MFHWEDDAASEEMLILVDGFDRQIGTATKMQAHSEGLLHRAFSVVLTRLSPEGKLEILLSRRADGKYHSAGLWANSCCSHPRAGEDTAEAALRRVPQELGLQVVPGTLREIGAFVYRAPFANGLAEYEYDHVFVAECSGEPAPDPSEVSQTRWVSAENLAAELAAHPERFAVWAFTVLPMALAELS